MEVEGEITSISSIFDDQDNISSINLNENNTDKLIFNKDKFSNNNFKSDINNNEKELNNSDGNKGQY